jgi:hypothetical protein
MYVRIHLLSDFSNFRTTVKFRFFWQYWRTQTVDLCGLDSIDVRVFPTLQITLQGPRTVDAGWYCPVNVVKTVSLVQTAQSKRPPWSKRPSQNGPVKTAQSKRPPWSKRPSQNGLPGQNGPVKTASLVKTACPVQMIFLIKVTFILLS